MSCMRARGVMMRVGQVRGLFLDWLGLVRLLRKLPCDHVLEAVDDLRALRSIISQGLLLEESLVRC